MTQLDSELLKKAVQVAVFYNNYSCELEEIVEMFCIDAAQAQAAVEPVAYTVAGEVNNWARDFSKYRTQHYVRPVYTSPPDRLHNGHDAKHWNLLAVMRHQENCAQQEAMRLALEALKKIRPQRYPDTDVDAAIAALEKELNRG